MKGSELKQSRIAHNLSRRMLASMTGLHPDSIRYWEQKPVVDIRGYGPRLIFKALGLEVPEPPVKQRSGPLRAFVDFRTPSARARQGVIERCGAKTRSGTPCKCKPMPHKRRCKYHGGASTGSRTPEGRQRQSEAQHRRWARWRSEKTEGN